MQCNTMHITPLRLGVYSYVEEFGPRQQPEIIPEFSSQN